MKMLLATLAGAAGLTNALVFDAAAQDRALLRQLQEAARIDCRFTQLAKADWPDDGAEFNTENVAFEASFFDIDVEGVTAEAEGRFGASYIVVRFAEGYLHFMQTPNSGPLYLTTVLAEASADGRLKAVHTRHEYTAISLPGFTSRPEMYVGDCAIETVQN
jgi:hypothetical protein